MNISHIFSNHIRKGLSDSTVNVSEGHGLALRSIAESFCPKEDFQDLVLVVSM